MCDCLSLDEVVNCGDNEQEEFVIPRRLRLLRERPRRRLYICPDCGTYWQVDHNERGPQAIKVPDPFKWDEFEERPYRLGFLERFHGGLSDRQCIWQGCGRFALKNMAFCVHHAYPEVSDGGNFP